MDVLLMQQTIHKQPKSVQSSQQHEEELKHAQQSGPETTDFAALPSAHRVSTGNEMNRGGPSREGQSDFT